jgi:hypothetical protein
MAKKKKLLRTKLHIYLAKADYVADSIGNFKRQAKAILSPFHVVALYLYKLCYKKPFCAFGVL